MACIERWSCQDNVIQLPVGLMHKKDYSQSNGNSKSKGMIDRISLEFSDIYSVRDIE